MSHNIHTISRWVAIMTTLTGCAARVQAPAAPQQVERSGPSVVVKPATAAPPHVRSALDMCDRQLEIGVAEVGRDFLSKFSRFRCVREHELLLARMAPTSLAPYADCLERADGIDALQKCVDACPRPPRQTLADCERLAAHLRALLTGADGELVPEDTLPADPEAIVRNCSEEMPLEKYVCLSSAESIDALQLC